ncbi:radical SAM protein [Oligella sp. HMSC09E12]|uniref:radical SAM protein n=1 Tax=Oligella sp. HMSC09E12 TaxID=1581147 RepID=UPI0008A31284|nr:radical SAM protein [Oligella sp. HMSC09E12]OFV47346.1 hypothetical protein HMPREF3179_08620 [Oligella sp. HMSC09E12]
MKVISITDVSQIKTPVLNDDGISIKGCNYIYAPKGQAGEYAELAVNLYRGCSHACAYCYVPAITRQRRVEFNKGAVPRNNIIHLLKRDAAKYKALNVQGQAMLSFTSDPYPQEHHETTRDALFVLRDETDLGFCTLTKGGTRALRDLDLFRPDKDAFATTMTSLDESFQRKWEQGAASPSDRIEALKAFHNAGIFTWVSLEPTLDIESSLAIVDATHEFVDLYKVGRANYLPMTKTTDWEYYTHRMIDKLQALGNKHYIKQDLQPYLPDGYHNPLRIPQHH